MNGKKAREYPRLLGKLGRRLFYFFGLASLIPLFIMIAQGYHCAHRAINNAAQAHLLSFVESKKQQISTWLKEREADIHFMAQIPCLQSCSCHGRQSPQQTKNVCNIVHTLAQRYPAYEKIYVLDLQGNVIAPPDKSNKITATSHQHSNSTAISPKKHRSPKLNITSTRFYRTALQTPHPIFSTIYVSRPF